MAVSNDFYVGKGKMLTHKGQKFREGCRFPAADLELNEASFASLVRDGSIVTGKERNALLHPAPAPAAAKAATAGLTIKPPPSPPPFKVPATAPADGLDEMKKDDLLDMAEDLGIPVKSRDSKEEIIKAIRGATK